MFAILGLAAARRSADLRRGQRSSCIPTTSSSTRSPPSSPTPGPTPIDHDFRMRHASGNWVWLRARCELVQPARRAGPASDRHRGRHHRAEDAGRADRGGRYAPARRHRDHPGSVRAVGRTRTAWCCATPTSRTCTACPTRRSPPARPTRRWSRPAASTSSASKLASEDPAVPGARTFEAQLDDGHWLQISERRTKDGGYVSVGTDITAAEAAREEADRQRAAADGDRRRPAPVAAEAGDAGRSCELAETTPSRRPRRGGQPGQVQVPRQHEPRAAHAAQRHHRLLRDHGVGDVRRARRRQISRILPRHPPQRRLPARRHQRHPRHVEDRGRPRSSSTWRTSSSTASSPTRCASSRRARRRSSSRSPPRSRPASACSADRRALKQIALNLLSNAVKFTPESGRITVRGRAVARRRGDRHPGFRHRHRRATRCRSSAGRSSRSRASSPRPTTARGWASPSPSR